MEDMENLTNVDLKRMVQIEYNTLLQAEEVIRNRMIKLYHDTGGFMRCPKYPNAEMDNIIWIHLRETADFLKSKRLALLDNSVEIRDFGRK